MADPQRLDALLVELFLDSHAAAPEEIVLDVDATDDPLHGRQEGRFFHGYYDCYCYLPLYVPCGPHLLCGRLRRSNRDAADGAVEELQRIVGQIRQRWPRVRVVVRGDAGFCRDELMAWCEAAEGVDYVFGLAQNAQLKRALAQPGAGQRAGGVRGDNQRFVVTSLERGRIGTQPLYEQLYCSRGDMENRIKEQQLDLFADRTSAATRRANQLRLYWALFAAALLEVLRQRGRAGTELARLRAETPG